MSDQHNELVPKLRFKEFENANEWNLKRLDALCDVLQGYGFPEVLQGKINGKYPFCKVSDISRAVAENGGLLGEASNYIDEIELKQLRAKLIPRGATVFAKIGEALRLNRRAYVLKECLIDNNVTALKAINGKAIDYFVYQLSQLIDLNKHCGGAVPSVNKSTLEEIKVIAPSIEEQQKIANCLSSLDDLITVQNQKVEALKQHKKGLMQQLLPAEGETVPKLRFPEFQDKGQWEKLPLSALVKALDAGVSVNSGDRPAMVNEMGILKTSAVTDGIFDSSENKVVTDIQELNRLKEEVTANTIIISRMNTPALVGANAYIETDHKNLFLPDRLWAAKPRSGTSMRFVAFILGSVQGRAALSALATGTSGSMKNIAKASVLELQVLTPSPEEQQKIADCLSSLDELITTQTQQLEAYKAHKKGLMQQLFPSLDEVDA